MTSSAHVLSFIRVLSCTEDGGNMNTNTLFIRYDVSIYMYVSSFKTTVEYGHRIRDTFSQCTSFDQPRPGDKSGFISGTVPRCSYAVCTRIQAARQLIYARGSLIPARSERHPCWPDGVLSSD